MHDSVNKTSFWTITNKMEILGGIVVDPSYVRIDVKENNKYHSVTRLFDDSVDEETRKFKEVMLAILSLIPAIEGESLPNQDLLAVLANDQSITPKSSKSARQGMYFIITSNVVQAAWNFNGNKKQVIVSHDSSHNSLGMGHVTPLSP